METKWLTRRAAKAAATNIADESLDETTNGIGEIFGQIKACKWVIIDDLSAKISSSFI